MNTEKDQWVQNLARNLKKFREDQGLTQQGLAEKARISISTVSKIESGTQNNVSLEILSSIGIALRLEDSLNLLR